MTEIKVRGKNRLGGWVYGIPLLFDTNKDCEEVTLVSRYIAEDGTEHQEEWIVQRKTICKYTGLKDKNRVEIYKGDIIESDGCLHVVRYDEDNARFAAFNLGMHTDLEGCGLTKEWIEECGKVVIGNVHDNPELLTNNE